jgi:PAS domain S-box-containing protein
MDRARLSGLRGSFLGDIDDDALEILLRDATIEEVPRGHNVFPLPGQQSFGVMLEGMARAYMADDDGRQLTMRYARPPSVVSPFTGADGTRAIPIQIEAVRDACVLMLDFAAIRTLVVTNLSVANAVAAESARRLNEVYRAFSAAFYGSLTERLAAHLVYASEPTTEGIAVSITQHDLATVLGSAREVVARSLSRLEQDGLINVKRGRIVIPLPDDLIAAAGQWLISARVFPIDASLGMDDSFDALPHAVVAVDARGAIVYANDAAAETFAWRPRDVIGQPIETLMPTSTALPFRDILAGYMDNASPRPIGLALPHQGRRSDGTEFPAEVTVLPVRRRDTTLVFATVVDVSYRSRLRELVSERADATARRRTSASSRARQAS